MRTSTADHHSSRGSSRSRTGADKRHRTSPGFVLPAILLVMLLTGIQGTAGTTVTLEELERKIHNAPQVLVAAAELEQQIQLFEREQALSGWKIFGGFSNGTYQEASDANKIRHFNQASIRMGLRYPLLGSRKKEQLSMLRAEARTWENRHKLELASRIGLNALRSHYVNYWGCERRIELSKAFLDGRETLEAALRERVAKGFLLEADRQEFITAFGLAERNIANAQAIQKRALGVICLLTNGHFETLSTECPTLPLPCVNEARLKARILDTHPELALRRSLMDEQLGAMRLGNRSDVDASLDLSGNGSVDYPAGQPGYGLTMSFNVQLPARIKTATEAGRQAARAGLNKTKLELDQKSGELLVDAAESLEKYHAAYANLRFSNQRVKAALESVRENQLRAGYLPGDTLEKLQQSRFQYYQTSLDLIDAEVLFLQAQATLLQLAPEGCERDADDTLPDGPTQSVIQNDPVRPDWLAWPKSSLESKGSKGRLKKAPEAVPIAAAAVARPTAVYHWETEPWLDGSIPCQEILHQLAEHGVGRVLLGLNEAQIRRAQTVEGARSLRAFLEGARSGGVTVDLLLGEPTWILPGAREDLITIIQQLKDLPFDGLHLDLEPDQLDTSRYSREYLLGELTHTLQAVGQVSPWPVGISVHPRFFDKGKFKLCLACALETMRISEVVLMVYVSDPAKAAERVRPILKRNPGLRFSVALSVEPSLDTSESYAVQGAAAVSKAVETLKQRLGGGNFFTVVIQSWRFLEMMKP